MKKILTFFLTLIFIAQLGYCGVDFDAADDLIACGTSDTLLTENGAITISAWIYPDTQGESDNGRIVDRDAAASQTGPGWSLSLGGMMFRVAGTTNLVRRSANGSITTGVWQHVLMTWDGSTTAANVKMYINGTETSSYQTTQNGASLTDNSTRAFRIGNTADSARTFDGVITEVAVWNVVLSAPQIALLASSRQKNMPLQLLDPDADGTNELVGYWPMDEGTHGNSADLDTCYDWSGNANDGNPDNGANNTGLTWSAEVILDYPSPIIQ